MDCRTGPSRVFFQQLSGPTISGLLIRLQPQMTDAVDLERMALEQDQRISEVVKREPSRLLHFIRRRVPTRATLRTFCRTFSTNCWKRIAC
jgi:hypothetical protein